MYIYAIIYIYIIAFIVETGTFNNFKGHSLDLNNNWLQETQHVI